MLALEDGGDTAKPVLEAYMKSMIADNPGIGSEQDEHGNTLLHVACEQRNARVLRYILDNSGNAPVRGFMLVRVTF